MNLNSLFEDEYLLYVDKDLIKKLNLHAAITLAGLKKCAEKEDTNIFDENGIFNEKHLQQKYLSFFSLKTIHRSIKFLKSHGYLSQKQMPSEKIKDSMLKAKANPKYICEWCNCGCNVLNEHHYPVPKSKGGTKTVKICPNCHYEFHSMEKNIFLSSEVANEL